MTPKPPARPPAHSEPAVIEHQPPAIPSRYTKPGAGDHSRIPPSSIDDGSTETSVSTIVTVDSSPRAGKVAAIHNQFALLTSLRLKLPNLIFRAQHTRTEPARTACSPSTTPPPTSVLFAREDSLELPGSSNSSQHSPFSDNESEISEVSLPPATPPRKMRGSFGNTPTTYPNSPTLPTASASRHPRDLRDKFHHNHTNATSSTSAPVTPGGDPGRKHVGYSITSATASRMSSFYNKLPPPPTRTIALGDKLPPLVRRPPSPSTDEESSSEEDLRLRAGNS
ncbi:hypothetical protein PAXINDRAFT_14989 [Paxillus involutus ATCC 200175]|uniref:Uncharacterized protein n=1 Tax=Paxillus involutus ATCC 200175 TaxID=664439 RepID=A0A0C9STP5_PAXIN|nr:hypothetical protein PAXINDRAFT_14989 [Paxillus involutus ATCC 200175]